MTPSRRPGLLRSAPARRPCRGIGPALAFVALLPGLSAQETAPATPPPEPEEELVVLSVFQVDATKDDRYRAANSVSATGLNTRIKDLPMTIQVITSEFIKDLGATDFSEALAYAAGVNTDDVEAPAGGASADANRGGGSSERSASSASGSTRFANTVNIRGFNVPFQNRLGFRYGGVVITPESNLALGGLLDASNMDRMEVVKGPNSMLYGIGVISGIVNVIPKKPLSVQRQSFSATAGSNAFLRTTAEITGPLIRSSEESKHRLNYRVVGTYEERDDWTDFRTKELKYGALQLDYWYGSTWNVFAEFQKASARYGGTGAQWIYDDLNLALVPDFRNAWDEQYNFGQDGNIAGLSRASFQADVRGRRQDFFEVPAIASRALEGGTLPDSYRITGPDTYENRDETDLLFDVSFTPSRSLAFSTGVFYTEADEEELAVNVRTLNNREGSFNIRGELPLNFVDVANSEFARHLWALKNEAAADYISGYDPLRIQGNDDYKLTRYWWTLRPQKSESLQWRLRGTYDFETPFVFGGDARHTILAGYHYINDNVDFLDGNEDINRAHIDRNNPYVLAGRINVADAASRDALYFRSIDDLTPLRYTGQNLAMPGETYRNQDVTFHGAYGILQSRFWDERIELIAGLRFDRYNAETKELLRISPEDQAIGAANLRWVDNPLSEVYGETAAVKSFAEDIEEWSKTFALNYDINPALTVYGLYAEGISPNTSLTDGNGDTIPAENTRSIEIGFKWEAFEGRLSGTIAAYDIKRENAIWQWSQAPAPIKWVGSANPPIGYEYSGSEFNPAPTNGVRINYGVDAAFIPDDIKQSLLPNLIVQGVSEPGRSSAWFVRDRVTGTLTRLEGLYDVENHQAGPKQPFNRRDIWWLDYANLDTKQTISVHVLDPNGDVLFNGQRYSLRNVNINFRAYIEAAFARRDLSQDNIGQFDPIRYSPTPQLSGVNPPGNSPSAPRSAAGSDAFVTFTDKARGMDFELIYSPSPSLQLLLNYSHTERKAEGTFHLVDWIDLNSGAAFGTEYDEIYRILGRENAGIIGSDTDGDGVNDRFVDIRGNEISAANPARPSDFFAGLDDISLFFNPEDEASFWVRYSFLEGRLKGLGLSGGARYFGPAQTSIPIGGNDLGQNLFRTPETAERWRFDAGLYYGFKAFGDRDWRLSLNIYNLTDDTEGLVTTEIQDPNTGREVTKRTRTLYAPRTWRLGVSVDF